MTQTPPHPKGKARRGFFAVLPWGIPVAIVEMLWPNTSCGGAVFRPLWEGDEEGVMDLFVQCLAL